MSSRGDDAEREGGGPGDDSTARKHGGSQDETAKEDRKTDLKRPLLDSGIRGSSSRAILCTLIVALGSIQSGFTSGYASPTQDCIREDLNLSVPEFSRFGSFSNVGAALGALLSGLIAESRGHRASLAIASIPNIIGWLLIVHAKDSCFLYTGRLLEGFGVGIIAYTVPVYIAEIAPLSMTGALGSVHQLSVMIGIFLAYLLGMFVQWRLLAAIGCLPCTALLIGLCFIQESPWWLEKRNRTKDSEDSLRALRGDGTVISDEAAKIKEEVEKSQRTVFQFAHLMEKNYRNHLTIGIGLLVLQQLTGINGILYYASTIFKDAGYENSNVATCVLGAIQVVATGFTTWLLDKTGQKKLLLISCGGATVSLFLVTLAFFLKDQCIVPTDSHFYCEQISSLSSAGVVLYVIAFSLGLGAIPWIIMSEILPLNIKSYAGSLATFAHYLASSLVTISSGTILKWSDKGTFAVYCLFSALTLAFVMLLVDETNVKTLDKSQSTSTEGGIVNSTVSMLHD